MPEASGDSQGRLGRWTRQFGVKVGIVVLGLGVAIASLERTVFLKPAVIERPVQDMLSGRATKPDTTAAVMPLGADVQSDRIAYWLTRLTTSLKQGVEATLGKKTQYDTMIAAKLQQRHMPADLVYLAMIESEFNPQATSPVKAKGLWQFMAATARQFGLKVGGGTDERTNPEKATDAALQYLDALHSELGSWYLAAAAYNSGAGTVRKALRAVTGKTTGTDSDFFKILPRLPKETQDYVPKLIATAKIGHDPAKYGLHSTDSSGAVQDSSAVVKESPGEVSAPFVSLVPMPGDSTKAATKPDSSSKAKTAPAKKKAPVKKKKSTSSRTRRHK